MLYVSIISSITACYPSSYYGAPNLAYQRQAFASEVWSANGSAPLPANVPLLGEYCPTWRSDSVFISTSTPPPWWVVDLGVIVTVSTVVVMNREYRGN